MEYLEEADRKTKIIDHMLYVTFPLIKDKKLLLKILSEAKISIANCINSILQYEYLNKNINLSKDAKFNFKTFIEKCSKKYNISENEIKLIIELFEIAELHKQSPFEFSKGDKLIILTENMNQRDLTIDKVKEFLLLTKDIVRKTKASILRKI